MIYTETHIDVDRRAEIGYSGPLRWEYAVGLLFKRLQSEYGRCTSKIYRDSPDGPIAVGWVFEKKVLIEPALKDFHFQPQERYYMQEVWVELFENPKNYVLKAGDE